MKDFKLDEEMARAVISFKPEFKDKQLFNTVEIIAQKIPE